MFFSHSLESFQRNHFLYRLDKCINAILDQILYELYIVEDECVNESLRKFASCPVLLEFGMDTQ